MADDELLDELNRIADGIWNQRKRLNQKKLQTIDYLSETGFSSQFDHALNNWLKCRKIDWKNIDRSLEKILGVDSTKDYWDAYHKFLDVVTIAKSKDLIEDNEITKEIEEYREKLSKLEKILTNNETTMTKQRQIIDTYRTQIKELTKIHPQFEKFFGAQEGDIDFE
ncbi:MAG: hypothetical protein KGZ37_10275 [Nitrosarchaeum sp.]|nr:hypothetical protein [Nitrosarchaeum sp.]